MCNENGQNDAIPAPKNHDCENLINKQCTSGIPGRFILGKIAYLSPPASCFLHNWHHPDKLEILLLPWSVPSLPVAAYMYMHLSDCTIIFYQSFYFVDHVFIDDYQSDRWTERINCSHIWAHNDWDLDIVEEEGGSAAQPLLHQEITYNAGYPIAPDEAEDECPYCLCRPCVTSETFRQGWWEEEHPPHRNNHQKRRPIYYRFWGHVGQQRGLGWPSLLTEKGNKYGQWQWGLCYGWHWHAQERNHAWMCPETGQDLVT